MRVYYNEFDPKAAAWLRALMAGGLIPKGEVDERSIQDVRGSDLAGYDQCHFFAGIGGWAEALRLARWEGPVWTGSCPCQPFSAAGKGEGVKDKRHLWPELRRLIAECAPPVIFGEQVASALGREWLSGVRADLEALAHAVGSADLCAASSGAPHIRQRLWWVAESDSERCDREHALLRPEAARWDARPLPETAWSGATCGLAKPEHTIGCPEHKEHSETHGRDGSGGSGNALRLGDPDISRSQGRREHFGEHADQRSTWTASELGGVAVAHDSERRPNESTGDQRDGSAAGWNEGNRNAQEHRGTGYWSAFDLAHCTDGKSRRIEPGTFPLVARLPAGMVRGSDPSAPINALASAEARIMRLRGYGNAIVPAVAAEFITAYMECRAQ